MLHGLGALPPKIPLAPVKCLYEAFSLLRGIIVMFLFICWNKLELIYKTKAKINEVVIKDLEHLFMQMCNSYI